MRRWLYFVTAITLIAALGVISIGCLRPSNEDLKKAIIAYERKEEGIYLTEDDIEIVKVGTLRIIPFRGTNVKFYPVRVRIKGQEANFTASNQSGEWMVMKLPEF